MRKQIPVFSYMLWMQCKRGVGNCVRTVDTDVVVLAISMFHRINAEELWLAFGASSSF